MPTIGKRYLGRKWFARLQYAISQLTAITPYQLPASS
ncbi:hypothetical protein YPC_2567 [Yersinia pestis biovar Medievalis str. Harbin 35]|nr:hypothetical protein YPC_2567 [Yersinia pestis biovar Medievalis str. Harbin 35]EEO76498.1 hypothetical protein YP516_2707 [Yersinia pestis Nepal516]EEO81344.1 hypothetical protein YPF_2063 [Yersinia pestis biovar Orientalis str. India 195]EEO87975.1 hypothetical protein YPH_3949 [Yersinia pestis biovar Orientalis str. PEXU2]EEO90636.1 hypothetical protein YPS_1993 [Yersinia pestis Pestoides A]